MARNKTFGSFEDMANAGIDFGRGIETMERQNDDTADNRMFVWNFSRADLEDFVRIFNGYGENPAAESSRYTLKAQLQEKISAMLAADCVPIECMLYASKVINSKLTNETLLVNILAEKTRDAATERLDESIEVLDSILHRWTWTPQLKIAIEAAGLIGDDELLDYILSRFGEDDDFRLTVFHSFMHEKNDENFLRALKLVMNLRKNSVIDDRIAKLFKKNIAGFGTSAMQEIAKYLDNPGVSFMGKTVFTQVLLKNGSVSHVDDNMQIKIMAKNSKTDNDAYAKFLEYCREDPDKEASFLCRFSRPQIVEDYLAGVIKSGSTDTRYMGSAVISMAQFACSGHAAAEKLLREYNPPDEALGFAYLAALVLLCDEKAAKKLVAVFSEQPEHRLHALYNAINNASITKLRAPLTLVQTALLDHFHALVEAGDKEGLNNFASNLNVFWTRRVFTLISDDLMNAIGDALSLYANQPEKLTASVAIALIGIGMKKFDGNFEKILFAVYRGKADLQVKNFIFRCLKERNIQAPA